MPTPPTDAARHAIRDRAIRAFAGHAPDGADPVVAALVARVVDFVLDQTVAGTTDAGTADADARCLRVSATSVPRSVAGAIAGGVADGAAVRLAVVGAGAANQALKAIALARRFPSPGTARLVCAPSFTDLSLDGRPRTGLLLHVGTCRCPAGGADPSA